MSDVHYPAVAHQRNIYTSARNTQAQRIPKISLRPAVSICWKDRRERLCQTVHSCMLWKWRKAGRTDVVKCVAHQAQLWGQSRMLHCIFAGLSDLVRPCYSCEFWRLHQTSTALPDMESVLRSECRPLRCIARRPHAPGMMTIYEPADFPLRSILAGQTASRN